MIRPTSTVGKAMMQLVSAYTDYKDPLGPGVAIQRKGAVRDFFVEEGSCSFEVHGGRDRAFEVEIYVSLPSENIRRAVESGEIQEAVPKAGEIQIHHVCPDWAHPCRHEIAALLQLVKEFDEDHNKLLKWRGIQDPKQTESSGQNTETTDEAERKAKIRSIRENLAGNFLKISNTDDTGNFLSNQEIIDFFSFPKEVSEETLHEKISQSLINPTEDTPVMVHDVNAKSVFDDALEALTEFLLKN